MAANLITGSTHTHTVRGGGGEQQRASCRDCEAQEHENGSCQERASCKENLAAAAARRPSEPSVFKLFVKHTHTHTCRYNYSVSAAQ